MSGSWSNAGQSLIILTESATGFSGMFGYSPTVGAGNLVFSLTAAPGTDPYGNAYQSGLTIYAGGQVLDSVGNANGDIISYVPGALGSYLKMGSAKLTWGSYNSNTGTITPDGSAISTISNTGLPDFLGKLILSTPRGGEGVPDQLIATLQSGNGGNGTGSGINPRAVLLDGTGTSAVDLWLSGSVMATDLAGTPRAWFLPAYKANWSGTSVFNGLGGCNPLRIHMTAENEVRLYGPTTAAAGAGTTVATLPAPYFDSTHTLPGVVDVCSSTNVLSRMPVAIDTSGNVLLANAAVTGSTYLFDLRLPLGKLP